MNDEVIINVVKEVGDSICVTDEDGKKVYDVIAEALKNGKKVKISFNGVTDLTSAFLNNAIGKLYSAGRSTSRKITGFSLNSSDIMNIVS